MKFNLLKQLMFLGIMLSTSIIFAQTVTGTVTSNDGPLPGVNVIVKGTTNGVVTDFDGNYSIDNVAADAVLQFSFIGFTPKEVAVNGQSVINVILTEDANELDEVVIIGYGSTTKTDATGAVDAIGAKDFTAVNTANPSQLIRGKVSGVQVTQTSGEPGGAISIRVRGNTSLRSGNDPLIVVDGIPLSGGNISAGGADGGGDTGSSTARSPLNFINQNDIESINILKDASSTAIYGSRGANGVILITTKKGKIGKPSVSYATSLGFSKITNEIEMMSSSEYAAQITAAGSPGLDHGGSGYNYVDALMQSATTTSHDLSINLGGEDSRTRVSISALSQEGIVKKTGLDKYSFSLNNSTDMFDDFLSIDTKFAFTQIQDQAQLITDNAGFVGSLIGVGLYWNPTYNLRNSDGSFNVVSNTYLNPEQLLNSYKDNTATSKVIASFAPTFKITDELSYKFVFGVEYSTSQRAAQMLPTMSIQNIDGTTTGGSPAGGYANINNVNFFNKTFENILMYKKDFSDNFKMNALAGFSYYQYNFKSNFTDARFFNINQTNLIDNIEGGRTNDFTSNSARNQTELQSFFGRVETTIHDNLLINASLRSDGSTRVGSANTYDLFPAVGAAYKFIDDYGGDINLVKLRLNYGITGNQEFSPNSAIAVSAYADGNLNPVTNANDELKWETTTSYGAGIDFGFLESRISGSLDYFRKETEDLVFPQPAASTAPGAAVTTFVNLPGVLENTGVEVALNFKAIQKAETNFDINFNAAFLSNKITGYSLFTQTGAINGQGLSGAYAQVITNNEPIYSYYLREWVGLDSDGNSIYVGPDGNPTGLGGSAPKLIGKDALPDVNIGINLNFSHKQWDASMSMYGAYGGYIYNNTANALFFAGSFLGDRNVPLEYATAGQAQGDPNTPSTRYLESSDFLRLSNLSVGYNFNEDSLGGLSKYIKNARVYVNGSNLLVFTDYSGFDPEVDTNKQINGVPSAGMDYFAYPAARTFTIGLDVTF